MKRRLITAAMFLCCIATSFAKFGGSGSGTASDPYLISNPIHLNQIRNFLNQEVYFKLMNDIDLMEFIEEENPTQGWLPIGDITSNSFKGVLDGNGKTIKGLWIKRTSNECAGLFTSMTDATIKNLTIEAANIECLSGGIIAGASSGFSTITDCSVSGVVKGKEYLGGYVGQIHYEYVFEGGQNTLKGKCVLSNNIGKVSVIGTGQYVGGFAGFVSAKTNMSDCTIYNGDVRGTNYIGGLFGKTVGRYDGYGIVINITNCGFFGEITGTSNVGGLIGYIRHASKLDSEGSYIRNSFSISNIDATGDCIGGLIGYDYGSNSDYETKCRTYIDNNYYCGSVKGENNIGGIVGYKGGGEITSCLATGSVEGSSYVGGIMGKGAFGDDGDAMVGTSVLRNVAIDTQVTATTSHARRIGISSGKMGSPGTTDENKASNKVIVTENGVVQDIKDGTQNGAGVGAFTLKQKATYVAMGFDFNNVWEISDGEGYPYIIGSTQIWPGDRKDVSSLTISPITAVTYNGSAQTPAVTVTDGTTTLTNGTDYTVSYDNNINVGTATVTITGERNYMGTKTAIFTINAKNASDLTISDIAAVTYNGSAQTPAVVVKDGTTTLTSGTDYTVSYSNNINVGTATVSVTGMGNYKGTVTKTFTISAVEGSVKLNKSKVILQKGKTEILTATVSPSSLSDKSVTWKSSNPAVATVSSDGIVKGVKAGIATITCTSNATGLKASCKVTVGYVKLDQTEAILEKTKAMTLKATVYPSALEDRSVTWTSSNENVATVSSSGKVKGVKAGKVTITCTSNATGLKATCKVTVGYVKLDQTKAILQKTNTLTLTPTVYPSTLEDKSVTWTSSDNTIARVTVSSDGTVGTVKGVKAGTATITCTSNATGLSTTCTVTVGYVKLDQTEAILEKTKAMTLKATVYPSALEDRSVTWTSSNENVATVSTSGKVKGVKAGKVTITCTSNATGLKATCKVTVGYVKLDQSKVTVKTGKTLTLTPTVYPSTLTDKTVTWTSSDKSIATVSSVGKVKGISAGTAIITCTSNATGLSTTCTVTVTAVSGARSMGGEDDDTTGIESMDESPVVIEPFDVYNLSGRKVRHQVSSLDGLSDGIYIVNGKKILKK